MELIPFIQGIFNNPPVAYNPANQTLKGWVIYCLRDRGLLVDTVVNNADFEVKSKVGDMRFKVGTIGAAIDPAIAWILVDESGKTAQVIPASA
jgi:hypothetical protein